MRFILRFCFVTLLLLVSAVLARAQVLSGVDLLNSTVFQQHQSSFSGLGARVRLHSASLVEGFELMPYAEFWRNSTRVDAFAITTTRKDATLGADLRFSFRGEGWRPYVGAGFGLHFLSSEVDAPQLDVHHEQDSVIKGGLSALAGMTFPLTRHLDNFIEVKFHDLPGFSQLKLNMGVAWRL